MKPFQISEEIPISQVEIVDSFWSEKRKVNAESAIFNQWNMLEKSGTINNFRIVKGDVEKFREGYFYADSDAHKWSEAAATILQSKDDKELLLLLTNYLDLLVEVQEEDGYIFTYNQFHFPKQRWINFQIEHELYTFGHLIEAAIISYKVTDNETYLNLGTKAADLLVKEFSKLSPKQTPGHPELELALVKLYRITKDKRYFHLAQKFINKRGKFLFFGSRILKENVSQGKRANEVSNQKAKYFDEPLVKEEIMSDLQKEGPKGLKLRFFFSALTGKYFQQNKPLRRQTKPVGHCVRWGYLATAATMIYQETGDKYLLDSLQKAWNHMIKKRMYVTGGIGSLPLLEGFGRDYELNNRYAYNETCAAISSVFWDWEMLLTTGNAKYADLLEWQLYNAVIVGLSQDGKSYFYRNPLEVTQNLERQEWYKTACCPSNISRTLAHLSKYIYSFNKDNLWIHQYFGNESKFQLSEEPNSEIEIKMESELPWNGKIKLFIKCKKEFKFFLNIRIPSWTSNPEIIVNDVKLTDIDFKQKYTETASDLSVFNSYYISLQEKWKEENEINIYFPMTIRTHHSHRKIRENRNKLAYSKGPIVYCFECHDNPSYDLINDKIGSIEKVETFEDEHLFKLKLHLENKQILIGRPYYSWGNKGKSSMVVWLTKE